MRRWIFNLTCAASLLLFISISALWIRSYHVWDELWWGTCKPEWNFIRSVPGWVRIDHYGFWHAGWWAEQVTVKPRLYERPASEWQYDYSPSLELSRRGPSATTDYVLHGTLPHWLIALPFAGLPLWWTWRRVAGKSRWYGELAGVSGVVLTAVCVVSFWWHITFDVDTGRSYNVVAIDRAALRLRQVDLSIGLGQSIGFGASPWRLAPIPWDYGLPVSNDHAPLARPGCIGHPRGTGRAGAEGTRPESRTVCGLRVRPSRHAGAMSGVRPGPSIGDRNGIVLARAMHKEIGWPKHRSRSFRRPSRFCRRG